MNNMKKNNNDLFFDKDNAYDKAEKNEKLQGVEFWENNIKHFQESVERAKSSVRNTSVVSR